MVEKIQKFLHAAERSDRRAVAAYVDIDRFKDINDTLGHAAGDQLITAVAERLKSRLRPQDFLSRFGGDEFAILSVPAGPDANAALAARVAQAFASPFVIHGQSIRVTASVGLAVAPDNGVTADELMRHADIALYQAKNGGRDRAVQFTAEMAQDVEQRRSIELDLRAALETDQAAPQLSADHFMPHGRYRRRGSAAALASSRAWRDVTGGLHSDRGKFGPPARARRMGARSRNARSARWPLSRSRSISRRSNSGISILRPPWRTHRQARCETGRFVLEITEGVLLEATDHTRSILEVIRAMGFKTALDDFGTGYASLRISAISSSTRSRSSEHSSAASPR